jgi:hypothetical protein
MNEKLEWPSGQYAWWMIVEAKQLSQRLKIIGHRMNNSKNYFELLRDSEGRLSH